MVGGKYQAPSWCDESWTLTEVMRGRILSRIPRTDSALLPLDLTFNILTQPRLRHRHPHLQSHHLSPLPPPPSGEDSLKPWLLLTTNILLLSCRSSKYLQPMWNFFSIFIEWNNLMIHQNPKSFKMNLKCVAF